VWYDVTKLYAPCDYVDEQVYLVGLEKFLGLDSISLRSWW